MIIAPEALYPQGREATKAEVKAAWETAIGEFRSALNIAALHEVFVLVGPPGAGKSTWARENPKRLESLTFDACHAYATKRETMAGMIRDARKKPIAVWLRTPLDVCLARNAERPDWRRVPEHVIWSYAENLCQEPPTRSEGWADVVEVRG